MSDPDGAPAYQALLDLLELAAGAEAEARARLPKTRTVIYPTDRTIFDVAVELGQDASDLMSINSALEDPAYIPARTPVLVFA